MTRLVLVAAFALAPCGFQCPQRTDAYANEVAAVRRVWVAPLPPDTCGNPRVSLRTLPCDEGCLYSYQYLTDIVVRDDLDEATTRAAVRHETVHWLAWCTGYQPSGDAGHSMPELWGAGGVLERSTH